MTPQQREQRFKNADRKDEQRYWQAIALAKLPLIGKERLDDLSRIGVIEFATFGVIPTIQDNERLKEKIDNELMHFGRCPEVLGVRMLLTTAVWSQVLKEPVVILTKVVMPRTFNKMLQRGKVRCY